MIKTCCKMLKIKKVYFCFLAETLEPEEGALLLKDFEPLPFEFFDDLAVSGDLALPGDPSDSVTSSSLASLASLETGADF